MYTLLNESRYRGQGLTDRCCSLQIKKKKYTWAINSDIDYVTLILHSSLLLF